MLMENPTNTDSKKNGFFSEKSQKLLKTIKSYILKAIIWTLVACVIIGAGSILIIGANGFEVVGKFIGTLFILAGAALISVIEFHSIESGKKSAQALAIFGVVMNILWALLWILAMWGVFDIWDYCLMNHCMHRSYSVMGILTMTITYLSVIGLFGSYTLSLYEGNKKSIIIPLKITAVACLAYVELYSIYSTIAHGSEVAAYSGIESRFAMLAGFTGMIWLIVMILAVIISKREKNATTSKENREGKKKENIKEKDSNPTAKTDEELRAEIEEKVRREMIEKEVREKVEKEMAEKSNHE